MEDTIEFWANIKTGFLCWNWNDWKLNLLLNFLILILLNNKFLTLERMLISHLVHPSVL